MKKAIYKVGDTVYHWDYGRGSVVYIDKDVKYPVFVEFDNENVGEKTFTQDGKLTRDQYLPTLSFTPYDLVNGGFSQERPLPHIEVDTLVYVGDSGVWYMAFFSHFDEDGDANCFITQLTSEKTDRTLPWTKWSLTNPLEN